MSSRKPFDIFWFGDSGPNWIETVETLEIAKSHIKTLPQASSGSYAILERMSNRISFTAKLWASGARTKHSN